MIVDSHCRILLANSLFTGGCGLALVVAAGDIGRGLVNATSAAPWLEVVLQALGLGLIAYASLLTALSLRPALSSAWLRALAAADTAWVLATLLLLVVRPDSITAAGVVALGLTAAIVGAFGALQWHLASAASGIRSS